MPPLSVGVRYALLVGDGDVDENDSARSLPDRLRLSLIHPASSCVVLWFKMAFVAAAPVALGSTATTARATRQYVLRCLYDSHTSGRVGSLLSLIRIRTRVFWAVFIALLLSLVTPGARRSGPELYKSCVAPRCGTRFC